jgi:hypothetical protein
VTLSSRGFDLPAAFGRVVRKKFVSHPVDGRFGLRWLFRLRFRADSPLASLNRHLFKGCDCTFLSLFVYFASNFSKYGRESSNCL